MERDRSQRHVLGKISATMVLLVLGAAACTDGMLISRGLQGGDSGTAKTSQPIIESFETSPTTVQPNTPTAITWTWVFGNSPSPAPECMVDQGIGVITNGSTNDISLLQDTVFTLTCTNSAGNDTAQRTITVASTSCGPATCGGCCDANDACREGAADTLCGTSGALCTDCTSFDGLCDSKHCTNCTPECSTKSCGETDGCGGTCLAGSGCCEPKCSGKSCGADNECGGTCTAGSGCCTADCSDKYCGDPDGCGETCTAGSGCCTPQCADKQCGDPDGCGGTCNTTGCCTPDCAGKLCGDGDGCGSSCQAGSGCCTPQCSDKLCGETDGCSGTCAAGSGCCTPQCSDKLCGETDGCNGTCAAGSGCCTPQCSDKLCGETDGCDGTCAAGSGCCTPQCSDKLCGETNGCDSTCAAGSGCCTPQCSDKLCGEADGCDGTCAAGSGCTSCPKAPCDLVVQCGCATNEACHTTYQPDGATTCRAVTHSGTELDTCAVVEQCAKGYLCMGIGGAWNRCKRFCNDDSDCPGSRSICRALSGGSVASTNFCTSACDPVGDGISGSPECPAGYQCHALRDSNTGRGFAECTKLGAVDILGACSSATDCSAGLNCVFYPSGGMCMLECRLTAPASICVAGTTCVSYNNKIIIDSVEYGYCALP